MPHVFCFIMNSKRGKERKYLLAYCIEKHLHDSFPSFESICCKNRPLLALRIFLRSCQVMSCTFPPVTIEQLEVTLESFGVTVIVWKGGWHFCEWKQEALISQSGLLGVDTSIEQVKEWNKKAGRRHFENILVKSSLISWHLPTGSGEWGGRHFYRKLTLHEIKILEINAT